MLRNLAARPPRKPVLVEGRDFTTELLDTHGVRLTTIPLPDPSTPRDAPWGRNDKGLIIAPFGMKANGHPRRRMPGGRSAHGAIRNGHYLPPIPEMISRRLTEIGCDPLKVLADIAMKDSPTPGDLTRFKAAAELCSYIYPKRRSVEFKGETTTKHTFVIEIPPADRATQAIDVTPLPNVRS